MELSREDSLRGEDGAKVVLRDNKGNIVDSLDSPRNSVPKNGQDMILSLDQRIQTLAYDELNKAVAYHKAKAGTVVVLDAQTGEILALVNSPAYDPNQPGQANSEQRRNRAVTDMIEPGSAMKPFTMRKHWIQAKWMQPIRSIPYLTKSVRLPYKIPTFILLWMCVALCKNLPTSVPVNFLPCLRLKKCMISITI